MVCFLACFTSCKHQKHPKSVTVTPSKHQSLEAADEEVVQIQPAETTNLELEDIVKAIIPITESKEEIEEQSKNGAKKEAAFDLNVKEVTSDLVEINEEKDNEKKEETPKVIVPVLGSIVSSVVSSHRLNHRYENFQNSEDEYEDVVDLEGSELNADEYDGCVDDGVQSKQMLVQDEESSESLFSLSINSRKQVCDAETDEKEVNSPMPKSGVPDHEVEPVGSNQNARDRSQHCHSVLNPIENPTQWKEIKEKATTSTASEHQEKEGVVGSELNEDDYDGHVDDEVKGKQILVQEESSESLFSLSIDSRKQVCDVETDEKEVNSPEVNSPMPKPGVPDHEVKPIGANQIARDRSRYCHSVLNPIENLTQWKEVKEKATPKASNHQEKENISMEQDFYIPISPEPTLKLSKHCTRPKPNDLKLADQEIGVDTSLSSWLVESETTPKSNTSNNSVGSSLCEEVKSPRSREDRPILGAWTAKELKQLSASSTPKRSRSPSPDEIPIIGTVGSYWSRTDQNREDQNVKWKSTPFQAKLERALDIGILEA